MTKPIEGIVVDGSTLGNPGVSEYKGVNIKTGNQIFGFKIPGLSTNNITEFLAAVHGLAYCKKNNLSMTVYSDSMTAISWIKKRKCNTKYDVEDINQKMLILRAEKYLQENGGIVTFWNNKQWGENLADFGRKY